MVEFCILHRQGNIYKYRTWEERGKKSIVVSSSVLCYAIHYNVNTVYITHIYKRERRV
uniref:Uncharacterized protein n=1 Tax=Lepeophtheirus salmonis TaxID=72036 RepID=A0A0K2VB36_LEPSM